MYLGTGEIRGDAKIAILITPGWMEAARFEQGELIRYASCPWAPESYSVGVTAKDRAESARENCGSASENCEDTRENCGGTGELPVPLIAPFFTETGDREIPVFLIRAGVESGECEKTAKALENVCSRVIPMDIRDINPRRVLRHPGIFGNTRKPSLARRRKTVFALALLNILSLACSLRILATGTNRELSALQEYCREQDQIAEKAAALEREIGELNARQQGGKATVYEAIGGLSACLSKGWVKSLLIQGGKLSLEAEGEDSLDTLGRLQSSGLFSGLALHQASTSGTGGEVFTISGTLEGGGNYGKK
jgi:hypothetical protein